MIIMIVLAVIFDMMSKIIIKQSFYFDESIEVIRNFLSITYVKNTGAAWSIFDDKSLLVLIISGLIILLFIWYIIKNKPQKTYEKIAYSLILGGAIGNFLSRIIYGYVIDFIDIKIFGYDYPIFNLADVFIVIGVLILLILVLRGKNEY